MQVTEKPVSVKPLIPNPALPDANWADCYRLRVDVPALTAVEAARLGVGRFPPWVSLLMRIRNTATGLVGLKPSTYHSPDKIEMIGIFPVVSRSNDQVVLGFDDRHLDFRIVIDVGPVDDRHCMISYTTLVNRKILLGRVYIAIVTPFHKLIVSSMLADLGKKVSSQRAGVAV